MSALRLEISECGLTSAAPRRRPISRLLQPNCSVTGQSSGVCSTDLLCPFPSFVNQEIHLSNDRFRGTADVVRRPGPLERLQVKVSNGTVDPSPPFIEGRVPRDGVSPQPGQAEMRGTQRATADSRVGTVSLSVCSPSS